MPDFWRHSGFHLADRDAEGRLHASDALLRAWWMRPEVAPIAESCAAERTLHAALLQAPRRAVAAQELAALQDLDVQQNYLVLLAWRDRLLGAASLEAAYLELFRQGDITVPPLFIDQLTQMIVHNILHDSEDPLEARAAELLFRPQKVALQEGVLLLADAETIEIHATGANYGDIGRLLVEAKARARRIDLDVMDRGNAETYWSRSEKHDMVLSFNDDHAGLAAFCRVIEKWVRHFYAVGTVLKPLRTIESQHWAWHIGLDAEATGMLNDLYNGKELESERNSRILSLFRLDFIGDAVVRPDVAGHPVYLACAMNRDAILRIKPQNLLLNLPLASIS
jgi:hypothetical protein